MANPDAGRNTAFTWNGTSILGVREKGLKLNGAAIDVTSGENAGKRTLLTVSARDEVSISLSGVTKDLVLRNDWFAGTRTRAAVMTKPDGSVISGTFFLESYSEGDPYEDAITFEAEILLSGAWSYTPGA